MGESAAEMGSTAAKKTLRRLCCDNGWSYGLFWRFDHRNSMLLTLEDAYYEEQMGTLLDNMLLQVHMLGEGIIGQAAFTGKHRWMFSDACSEEWNSISSSANQDIFQGDVEIHRQFSSGIKTIAVISVESQGVVLFGSTQKILESAKVLDQTKSLFREMENVEALVQLECLPSSMHNEACDLSGLFASLVSSGNSYNGNLKPRHRDSYDELGRACSSTNLTESSPFMSEVHQTSTQFQHVFSQSSYSVCSSATETPCISTWSSEGSVLTLHDLQLPSEMRVQDSLDVFPPQANTLLNIQGDSPFTSLHGLGGLVDEVCNPLIHAADSVTDMSKCYMVDNLSELFSPSSGLVGRDGFIDIPVSHSSNPVQNSITNILNCDGQEKPGNVHGAENDLFDGLGLDFELAECWEDIVMPVMSSGHSTISTGISECISELGVASTAGPRKGLFSELGLEELLDGIGNSSSVTKASFEDQLSTTKRRRVEASSADSNQVQLANASCSSRSMNSMQPMYNLDKINNLVQKKEVFPKSQVGLWIDDSYSINAGSAVIAQPKKPEEPTKGTRKRARPGESTRPRPKDRQQIQERLGELRKIVPNGHKPSIDVLLDRTIKYMLFLQSVTKYADKLKQADEPKLIDHGNGVVLKDSSREGGSGGVTWAFEVGGQTLVCPIVVEDLNPPGQMLIEMLCEDQGLFLEIADIIRGFGLNILKGVMELRENKIWARFIVEANKHVTRIDIFWSLIQLLQQPATSGIDSTNQPINVVDGGNPLLKNLQQPSVPLPISLADTLQ